MKTYDERENKTGEKGGKKEKKTGKRDKINKGKKYEKICYLKYIIPQSVWYLLGRKHIISKGHKQLIVEGKGNC